MAFDLAASPHSTLVVLRFMAAFMACLNLAYLVKPGLDSEFSAYYAAHPQLGRVISFVLLVISLAALVVHTSQPETLDFGQFYNLVVVLFLSALTLVSFMGTVWSVTSAKPETGLRAAVMRFTKSRPVSLVWIAAGIAFLIYSYGAF